MIHLSTFSTVLCPLLSAPENGAVMVNGWSVGEMAVFTCNEGYELVGASKLTCQENGMWDNPPPMCIPGRR